MLKVLTTSLPTGSYPTPKITCNSQVPRGSNW